jgi:hypothetical protein
MEAVVNGSNYNGGGSLYLQSGETIRAQFATEVRFTAVRRFMSLVMFVILSVPWDMQHCVHCVDTIFVGYFGRLRCH